MKWMYRFVDIQVNVRIGLVDQWLFHLFLKRNIFLIRTTALKTHDWHYGYLLCHTKTQTESKYLRNIILINRSCIELLYSKMQLKIDGHKYSAWNAESIMQFCYNLNNADIWFQTKILKDYCIFYFYFCCVSFYIYVVHVHSKTLKFLW